MQLYIAAYGWDGPQWSEDFFPADLPEEWRFDYYANEFSALVLPYEVWQGLDIQVLRQWRDDAPDGFSFFLEWRPAGAGLKDGKLAQAQTVLGTALCGLLIRGGCGPVSIPASLPCCRIIDEEGDWGAPLEPVAGMTVCKGQGLASECDGGDLAVTLLPESLEPRELKAVIDRMIAGPQRYGLLVSPQQDNLRKARTIIELMGV